MTKVAIVILNWNGRKFLEQFMPALRKHSTMPGAEIIVADNASTDDSLAFMQEKYADIRIIELSKNYGFAGGYNKALEKLDAEYFLIINSDIEVREGYLEPLVQFMDRHKDFAACAPALLDFKNKEMYEYAGAAGGFIDKYGYPFCRGRIFNQLETANGQYDKSIEVFWTTGACMLARAEVFNACGGFDADFFAHMEEIDLCWRMKNAGYKLAYIPESQVYHVGGGTLSRQNPFKTYLNFRNNLFLLYKNLPEEKLREIIFKRKILDGISAIMFFVSFKFKDFRAVYKAHHSFRKKKNDLKKYRKSIKNVEIPEHPDIYQRSIVKDYFLARRKEFSNLRDEYGIKMNSRVIEQ